jgi:lantibiotic modifying enzyme
MGTRTAALLLSTLLLSLAPARAEEDYLAATKAIGESLLATARTEDGTVRWAQYEGPGPAAAGEELHFPVSLYSGLSGTGWFLLNLHLATEDERYLKAARGAGLRLLEVAEPVGEGGVRWSATYERRGRSVPDGGGLGLYNGNAGIGLFLLHLAKATGDARFRKGAVAAFERILDEAEEGEGGIQWPSALLDVIGGEAGIGLALLEMHAGTGDVRYAEAARGAAGRLRAVADRSEGRVRWQRYGFFDAAFAHGAAGIAFFLAAAGGKPGLADAALAADWIESVAKPCGEGAVLWEYYAGEPPEGKRNWIMNSWCHGAPGTIRLFLLLHRRTGEERRLDAAVRGGGGILHELRLETGKPFYYNPTLCCGAAGLIDAFLDLWRASEQSRWLTAARAVADEVVSSLVEFAGGRVHATWAETDRTEKKSPYVPTGLMHGNAGIGHALLRLALVLEGKPERLILPPDHPFRGLEPVRGPEEK